MAAALVLLMPACAGSRYHFLSSTSTHTFLKVPSSWRVYPQPQILAHISAANPSVGKLHPIPYYVIFDADPAPSLDHGVQSAKYPFGMARVRTLSADEQDTFSLASLRNETIPVDQLRQADPNAVQDIAAPRLITRGGLRGTHLEYTVNDGSTIYTADQIGLLDAATHTEWFLIVGCTRACYQSNAAAIHRMADTWTVRGK